MSYNIHGTKNINKTDRDFRREGPDYNKNRKYCSSFWIYGRSQIRENELAYLYDVSSKLGAGNYANLGCFNGSSAAALARGLKDRKLSGKVYTVDLYCGTAPLKEKGIPGPAGKLEETKSWFEYMKVEDTVAICVGTTNEWAEKLENEKFRFVFIDADHRYKACKEDFENWSKLVDNDGYVAFHDCHMDYVDRVITESTSGWELVDHYSLIKAFRRI